MSENSKIVLIIAGGIITQEFDHKLDCYVTKSNMDQIVESIKVEDPARNIEIVQYAAIDSSSADLDFFYDLAKLIQRKVNNQQVKGAGFTFFLNQ